MKIALENIENEDLKQFRVYKTQADTLSTDTTKHWVADMITKKPVNRVEVAKPEIGTTNVKNTYHFKMEGLQWKSGNRGEWNATLGLDDLPSPSSNKNSMNRINGSFRRQYGKGENLNAATMRRSSRTSCLVMSSIRYRQVSRKPITPIRIRM